MKLFFIYFVFGFCILQSHVSEGFWGGLFGLFKPLCPITTSILGLPDFVKIILNFNNLPGDALRELLKNLICNDEAAVMSNLKCISDNANLLAGNSNTITDLQTQINNLLNGPLDFFFSSSTNAIQAIVNLLLGSEINSPSKNTVLEMCRKKQACLEKTAQGNTAVYCAKTAKCYVNLPDNLRVYNGKNANTRCIQRGMKVWDYTQIAADDPCRAELNTRGPVWTTPSGQTGPCGFGTLFNTPTTFNCPNRNTARPHITCEYTIPPAK